MKKKKVKQDFPAFSKQEFMDFGRFCFEMGKEAALLTKVEKSLGDAKTKKTKEKKKKEKPVQRMRKGKR